MNYHSPMRDNMSEVLIKNISTRMEHLGISINELGKKSGVSSRMIRYILEGQSAVSVPKLEKISIALDISIRDLFSTKRNEKSLRCVTKIIPVFDYREACHWKDAFKIIEDSAEDNDHEYIFTEIRNSNVCFAIKIDGNSMNGDKDSYHSFTHGTYMHIDPLKKAEQNDFVLAQLKGKDRATFKQLKHNEGEPYLASLNPDYPSLFEDFTIIGSLYLTCKRYHHAKD